MPARRRVSSTLRHPATPFLRCSSAAPAVALVSRFNLTKAARYAGENCDRLQDRP